MPIPVKSKAANELIGVSTVLESLESWSIGDIRELIREIETELLSRPVLNPGAPRSRRARYTRRPPNVLHDAKLLARELMKKGHQVRAETLEGQNPVRIIADNQIFAWLAES